MKHTGRVAGLLVAIVCGVWGAPLSAQSLQLPTWPQQFSVQGPEVSTFGFAVTQPGTIAVEIQVQGGPVVATLLGPTAQPIQQQGSGVLRLSYNALPQDVQKSVFWNVSIKLAPTGEGATASGVIGVRHPPVDPAQIEAAVRGVRAQDQAARPQLEAAAAQARERMRLQIDATFQRQRADLQQQQAQRQAALMNQAQPAVQRLRAVQGGAVTTREVRRSGEIAPPISATDRIRVLPVAPSVTALSVGAGQSGDPVVINGTSLGSAGEVHFQIAPDVDAVASDVTWTDTQIVARVPARGGLVAFNGSVHVKRADQMKSNSLPFGFVPTPERRMLLIPAADVPYVTLDSVLPRYAGDELLTVPWLGVRRRNSECFRTPRGEDRFFINTRLKNGWKAGTPLVFSAYSFNTGGGAYLAKSFVGTDGPYVDVRWWINIGAFCFFSEFGYAVMLPIEGPLGTPDGVVIK